MYVCCVTYRMNKRMGAMGQCIHRVQFSVGIWSETNCVLNWRRRRRWVCLFRVGVFYCMLCARAWCGSKGAQSTESTQHVVVLASSSSSTPAPVKGLRAIANHDTTTKRIKCRCSCLRWLSVCWCCSPKYIYVCIVCKSMTLRDYTTLWAW